MISFFDGLFLMKNKEQLSDYMKQFIDASTSLGFTDFDIKKLVLALRVLYPDPMSLDDDTTLNFLCLLSASEVYYKDMDHKSQNYIEKMLDRVEDKFSGFKQVSIPTSSQT